MAAEPTLIQLAAEVQAWIEEDPDPATRSELEALLADGNLEELVTRFGEPLTFGTAGIRGPVGAGPSRMNRAVVIRTTAGVAAHLNGEARPVVVGFDARPDSRRFAEDAAGVLAAAGFEVRFFPTVTPTPLVAFAAKRLDACAAVVVTASHNPPADSGYKVYGSNAAQIIPPVDALIAREIERSVPAKQVPRIEDAFAGHDLVSPVPDDIFDLYYAEVDAIRPEPVGSDMSIAYTPIHGVGGAVLAKMLDKAGHVGLRIVTEQAEPDGAFPTVSFPNPEEKGAMDLVIDLARRESASLVIANDPDADRLAVALPLEDEFRLLTGNDVGALLGDYLLRGHAGSERPIVVNSVVSSPMLARLAARHDARHEVTLTGFKWIVNAGLALQEQGEGRFIFGYEEALGYSVDDVVRDKDGMSAALLFCDLVAGLRAAGMTVWDRLIELWAQVGVWASGQESIQAGGGDGPQRILHAVDSLASTPPASVAGMRVTEARDYRRGASERPSWLGAQDLVELTLGDSGRMLVRPSGTEPKLKVYCDLVEPLGPEPLRQHRELTARAGLTAAGLASSLGL